MKKILFILFTVVFSLSGASCSDSLNLSSYNTTDTETVFSSDTTAEMYVEGCYRGIVPTESFYQLGAGETVTHSCEDGTTNNSKYNICNYYYDATAPYTLSTTYKEEYRIIEATNIAIYRLKKMAKTSKHNSLLGEVLGLRAMAYLNLIRVYGDVPAVWQPLEVLNSNDSTTFYPKRASRDTIYDHIISDLQTAVDYLPWYRASGYNAPERLTKQGAYGLLARVALYAAGYSLRWNLATNDESTLKVCRRDNATRVNELYQIANDACEAIISKGENSLVQSTSNMSGFRYLWYNFDQRNFSATNSEMIFQEACYGANTNSDFDVYAHPGSRGGTFGSRKAMQFMLPTYYLSFNKKDTRRDVTCAPYSIYFLNSGSSSDTWVDVGTTYSCIMPGKFRISWCIQPQDASDRNVDIPILRYADVLLMYAETQNYLNNGPTTAAKNALQEVRNRAGIGSLTMPTTQDAFDDALLQERKWEFANEFMLRTDLIRMNKLASQLSTAKQAIKDLSDRVNDYANISSYRLYKFTKDAQTYGDTLLNIPYIDLTDANEIAVAKNVPSSSSGYTSYQTALAAIVKAHGITVTSGDEWYPVAMFEAYTSSFNGNARKAVGFTKGYNTIQVGNIIYTKPTGSAENGGTYPNWIEASDGSDGLYYGFKKNFSELLPFANTTAGSPMVDNPNLTQLPGY
jgi:starch-binding outer membrane protein, SusD/RagB family